MQQDYEKLGFFYLGKSYDLDRGESRPDLILYESKDLTTHAVCVGMTGSGKTGLCLVMLEEAAIDGIPVIAIDPKGDLGNLLLTFPELRPEDFRPWVDPGEAARRGLSLEEFAEKTANQWREGLAAWGQDGDRIARFRESVDLSLYTPASQAGRPLTILRSFTAPPAALVQDGEAYRERISAAVSGLLALLGITADPINSREHILLSNIFDHAWRAGRDLDLGGLIRAIQEPPFNRIGVLDLESVFPSKDRFGLAVSLNNLLASPGFAAWMEGEPLDVGALLATPQGKPRLSILSIAHLTENERMFFVTILLNEVLAWVRSQPGTSSLRAILYMDEVFGFFPPVANPPSKQPMLTLLKQARAYGLGIVLATQNPVDLDYKGLSNAGTWFLGRLQTERDKARVLEGLEGASAAAGSTFNRSQMEATLAGLGRRVFLMNNVHDDRPVVFETRWALSYLRGPLTRDQIQTLVRPPQASADTDSETPAGSGAVSEAIAPAPVNPITHSLTSLKSDRPLLPPDVSEAFLALRSPLQSGEALVYSPALLGTARLHYIDKKSGIDHWASLNLLRLMEENPPAANIWEGSLPIEGEPPARDKAAPTEARFEFLPPSLSVAKNYASWGRSLKEYLYRERPLTLWRSPLLKQWSRPGETERDFRLRLNLASIEERDLQVEKLRVRYAPKLNALDQKIKAAEQRLEKEKAQAQRSTFDAAVSFGSSLLQAMMGRKLASSTNVGRAATSARAAGRAAEQRGDVAHAADKLEDLYKQADALNAEFQAAVNQIEFTLKPETLTLERLDIRARKTEITVDPVVLAWTPYRETPDGRREPA